MHFARRSLIPDIYLMNTAEKKIKHHAVELGPVPLDRDDLPTVFRDPSSRAVVVFASELLACGGEEKTVELPACAATCSASKWLLDTGAAVHHVPKHTVHANEIFESDKVVRLRTANGIIETRDRVYVEVPGLDFRIEAVVLPKGEAALSVGRLIMQGFDFHWDQYDAVPVVHNPSGKQVLVWTEHHTPYVSGIDFQPIAVPALTGTADSDGVGLVPPAPEDSPPPQPPRAEPATVVDADDDPYAEDEVVDVRPKDRGPMSLSHMMTHYPFHPDCEVCVRANKKRRSHRRTNTARDNTPGSQHKNVVFSVSGGGGFLFPFSGRCTLVCSCV